MVRKIVMGALCGVACWMATTSQASAQAPAYGQNWGGAASNRDYSRFNHYPYVYYPQNFWGNEYYRSSDSLLPLPTRDADTCLQQEVAQRVPKSSSLPLGTSLHHRRVLRSRSVIDDGDKLRPSSAGGESHRRTIPHTQDATHLVLTEELVMISGGGE